MGTYGQCLRLCSTNQSQWVTFKSSLKHMSSAVQKCFAGTTKLTPPSDLFIRHFNDVVAPFSITSFFTAPFPLAPLPNLLPSQARPTFPVPVYSRHCHELPIAVTRSRFSLGYQLPYREESDAVCDIPRRSSQDVTTRAEARKRLHSR